MATVYRSVALIVGASLLSMAGARAAEEAAKPAEPADLAEVVVSVERVTQTLQSYAGTAVTATQSELDSLGATNLVDIPVGSARRGNLQLRRQYKHLRARYRQ
jgi:hypothetical protein